MTTITLLVGLLILSSVITGILFVAFGQLTVRKLRKNPATKSHLGIEFASGWDIINVAQALSMPKSWRRKLEKSSLSVLYANSDLLFEHTSKFDQILGIVFYWSLTVTGFSTILWACMSSWGIFD